MDAGSRNRLITVQRYVASDDPLGGESKTWADLTQLYAAVSFGTGKERRDAAQESASAPATFHVLRTPKAATITPADRIVFDGSDWDITSVAPTREFNVGIEITAVRRAA